MFGTEGRREEAGDDMDSPAVGRVEAALRGGPVAWSSSVVAGRWSRVAALVREGGGEARPHWSFVATGEPTMDAADAR
jgi:hypothetical protein